MSNTIKNAIKLVKLVKEPWINEVVITTDYADIENCPIYFLRPKHLYFQWWNREAPDYIRNIVDRVGQEAEGETHGACSNRLIYLHGDIAQFGLIYTTYVLLHELGHYDQWKKYGDCIISEKSEEDDFDIVYWKNEIIADIYALPYLEKIAKRGFII